jgi:acyl-[acyl-carrier-protein]-phospholipid O-acyltransferase/long-chain-fatty-acid--[acyl-carrier-protein] ligase
MFTKLLTSRRFAPLFACQFLSAFNDNFVRYILVMLVLFRLSEVQSGPLIQLAMAIFIIPSIFLSGLGGEWADAHDKAWLARRLKFVEIFVQLVAAVGVFLTALPLLYAALFGLGVIAALFGPIKYGLLPDHLAPGELPAGNALVEGATFLAILTGMIAGSYAAEAMLHSAGGETRTNGWIVLQMMVIAIACWWTSRSIPAKAAAAPGLLANRNIVQSTARLVGELRADRKMWAAALGLSWFWLTAAVVVNLAMILVKTHIGGGIRVETAINALFAIGIAIGSLLAAIIAHGRIILLPAPLAALGMAACLIDIGLSSAGLAGDKANLDLWQFFTGPAGRRLALDVSLLALAGGLYSVPLFSAIQSWAPAERRARLIAAVNVINAIFIASGAIITFALQTLFPGREPALLVGLGLLNGGVGVALMRLLPGNFAADLLNLLFRLFYRVEVSGLENVGRAGPRCVIAVNHVSFLDAPLILSLIDSKPVFAIDSQIAKAWWVRPFLGVARVFPMDPSKALSTRGLIQEVRDGQKLVIFPEGRLTVTGALMKIYDGAGMIADKADAMIVPVRIEGLEQTYFTRLSPSQVKRHLFPKVKVTFLPPRKLTVAPELKGRARRQAAGLALYDEMSDLIFETTDCGRTLMRALVVAIGRRGAALNMLQDPLTGSLSGRKLLIGAAILGRRIAGQTRPGETLALMLPNANGSAIAFFALQAAGRVAAMLNYTAGLANLQTACRTTLVKTVVTSRAFVDKAKLEPIVAALAAEMSFIYLEDLAAAVTWRDKLRGFLEAGREFVSRNPDDPAVVLFTSGSEGLPKGVALSHRNLLANIAQIMARFDISSADIVFNALPIFHSFGLTGGLLLPILSGMRLYLYPSPLHYRQIPELVYGANATVLFGTDTFLMGYARMANPYDFRSVRYIIAGAEPVKPETRRIFMDKFGQRILEGYGVTETAPVLAVNTAQFNRPGTVGRLMPGIDYRLEPIEGIEEGGRLHVRGPNVMLGYYRAERPGVVEPSADGWYDTGDIVTIDKEKFVTIKGRAKRFAKVAGEMVSLAAIEQMATDLWPEHPPAVVAVPDPKKGEKLIMVSAQPNASRADMQAHLKARGATELMVPAELLVVDSLPLLGSGKIDYVALAQMVRGKLGLASAA